MTPQHFITKWQTTQRTERAATQEHFLDLCRLLNEPTPAATDLDGQTYCFEKGTTKIDGGKGWADVWKRHHFAWKYKGKHQTLNEAVAQLQRYALALENPPLLIASDMETIQIHTHFTNTVQEVHTLTVTDLANPKQLQLLKWVFTDPHQLKPGRTRTAVTEEIAQEFASLAQRLRERGHPPVQVAHLISQLLFCLFAEAAGLFNGQRVFSDLLTAAAKHPDLGTATLQNFLTILPQGGLFTQVTLLPLTKEDFQLLLRVAKQDWKAIEPSIFGTLFERGLDPDKRSQLGAHYTDPHSILRLVQPVVLAPLQAEWQQTKAEIQAVLKRSREPKSIPKLAHDLVNQFLERLTQVRILDPACGSGNFLSLVSRCLADLEHQVILETEQWAMELSDPFSIHTGPQNVLGIEVNPYAAELAQVTIWIGHLQWLLAHGYPLPPHPLLPPIDCRDAVITADGTEPTWPRADFIVGNPPFLGNKRMIGALGEEYVRRLQKLYQGRVPGGADLVTYWFEKARSQVEQGEVKAVGLVATNSIRGGLNRRILERIRETGQIFEAWSDEPWINEGAAVRVSLVCFAGEKREKVRLNGEAVTEIFADLTGTSAVDLTKAKKLSQNIGVAFQGTNKVGPFNIPGDLARQWLQLPNNPNGRPNSDVLHPWANGRDVVRRPSDTWIIDFGVAMTAEEASGYEKPFEYIVKKVKPERSGKRDQRVVRKWWLFQNSGPGMRAALKPFSRFLVTPRVSKYRLFVWLDQAVLPDCATVAIARDDDITFGILQSRFHEIWSLHLGTWQGKGNDPRYTPTTTFATFPFPEGLTPTIKATDYADHPHAQAIARVAKRLHELRDHWLNPPEWIKRAPEVVPGYPDRLLPVNDQTAKLLKKRTLTNLYNAQPQWLLDAHRQLDEAVAAAYGWPGELTEVEILNRLLKLNLKRAS